MLVCIFNTSLLAMDWSQLFDSIKQKEAIREEIRKRAQEATDMIKQLLKVEHCKFRQAGDLMRPQWMPDAIKQGADANLQDEEGCSLLMAASRGRHNVYVIGMPSLLRQKTLRIDMQDKQGRTALDCGNSEAIKLLLRAGANPYIRGVDGCTKWHGVVRNCTWNALRVLKIFLKCGIDANVSDLKGTTPLMDIAQDKCDPSLALIKEKKDYHDNENVKKVQLLLEYGADRTMKDCAGKTALDYAKENGNLAIEQLLTQKNQKLL